MCQSIVPFLGGFTRGLATVCAGVGTIGCGLLYYGQNYLIYPSAFPPESRTEVPSPDMYGLHYEGVELKTEDGVLLRCYLLTQRKEVGHPYALQIPVNDEMSNDEFTATRPTVLMFHGNGGNLGHRIPLAHVFYTTMRCNVFMLSYRGYGRSEGKPSESGLCIDAQTVLDYILAHANLRGTPIILYGQSLGGAVAIHLASRNPSKIRALILENTFTSLPRVIPHATPILSPFTFLCHQKWDSASKLPLIPRETPILMLSGERDEVVPPQHMKELWEIASRRQGTKVDTRDGNGGAPVASGEPNGEPNPEVGNGMSRFVKFPHGYHNDTFMQMDYWRAVTEFVAGLCS
ncbi:Alpha/Beta hydrolase protein [Pisolithus orientalis]|uniref:Alpha/Beta hydrolase protein n=1 Tax=Pisolithus orientalis TaxID=936130 RepID=UPI0022257CED|nr:Alpha/Beta hydrolase protein [Pisolithus orientalis]KAI6032729.1 Alpha/Beta hydrolase protein [Pisolithus orientalis]